MKKIYQFSTLIILSLFINLPVLYAQLDLNESGFSFQGYARNLDGSALTSQPIEVTFTIRPISTGVVEFTEVHPSITTDAFGVFHVIIGSISTAEYKALDFAKNNDYYLKVLTSKSGGTPATISDAQMQSVPYAQAADNGVPVGSMIIFAGPKGNIPAGWLACDGLPYLQSLYPKLYRAIGGSWGTTGSSFNVPDMRGMFARGVDNGRTSDPDRATRGALYTGGNTGDKVGTYEAENYLSHLHGVTDPSHAHTASQVAHNHQFNTSRNAVDGNWATGGSNDLNGTATTDSRTPAITVNSAATGISIQNNGGSETRPENMSVWYIIRAR